MFKFSSDDVFIVTGANSGIGKGTALFLNKLGAQVVAIARDKSRLEKMRNEAVYPETMHIEVKDLTDNIESLPTYIKELKNTYGKFQGMAYCAGISSVEPLQLLQYEKAKKIFDINYFVPVMMAKGFADRRNNSGNRPSIVFIASSAALKSDKGQTVYSGSKSALLASAKSISRELQASNVRVNSVSPSIIKTDMFFNYGPEYAESQKAFYPWGYGEVADVVNMIVYLLSEQSKWINGQNYIIDSGEAI